MRILVTGGAGFIGSHTCLALLDKGYEVVVLESFANSYKESLIRINNLQKSKKTTIDLFTADIRDEKS